MLNSSQTYCAITDSVSEMDFCLKRDALDIEKYYSKRPKHMWVGCVQSICCIPLTCDDKTNPEIPCVMTHVILRCVSVHKQCCSSSVCMSMCKRCRWKLKF